MNLGNTRRPCECCDCCKRLGFVKSRAYTHQDGPLTVNDVLSARPIVDPLGKLDCCLVTDGGAAVVMTRSDRAKDTKNTPIYLLGAAMEHHHRMVSKCQI